MQQPSTIFQRTPSGRDEIYNKSHGLTQSERLVLIMIDGATDCARVRRKLPALTDERFNRALGSLQKKELILEVFMPVEGQPAEEVEPAIIDRFLQQDPWDPLTIIVTDDDEDEFDLQPQAAPTPKSVATPAVTSVAAPVVTSVATSVVPPVATPVAPPAKKIEIDMGRPPRENKTAPASKAPMTTVQVEAEAAALAADFAEIDAFVEQQRFPAAMPKTSPAQPPEAPTPMQENFQQWIDGAPKEQQLDGLHLHWGYLFIGIGIAFIAGFLLGRAAA